MNLLILGAGGYGRTVADVAAQFGIYEKIRFLDDQSTSADVLGPCGDYQNYIHESVALYPAFGNNEGRLRWIETLRAAGANIPTLVHPTAYVSPTATLGVGCTVLPHAIVNTNVTVGDGCIVNCGAMIDHGCVIEPGCHICLGAIVKGENKIASCTKVEAGEVIERGTYAV